MQQNNNKIMLIDKNYLFNDKDSMSFFDFDMVDTNKSIVELDGKNAKITISGILGIDSPWNESVSYGKIQNSAKALMNNEDVETVDFYFDTPGGYSVGCYETAQVLNQLSKVKNTRAFVSSLCCSAGYWLASQTGQITAQKHSYIGSIGCYNTFLDTSKMYKEQGVDVKLISSGDEKGQPTEGVEIPQAVIDRTQNDVNNIFKDFKSDVLSARPSLMDKEVFQGASFLGDEALKLGLIDHVGDVNFFNNKSEVKIMSEEKKVEEVQKEVLDELVVEPEVEVVEEEVEVIEEVIEDAPQSNDKERFSKLKEAFPENLAFAVEQFEKDNSVLEAKAEYCEVLKQEKEDASKVNESSVDGEKPLVYTQPKLNLKTDFKSRAEDLAKEKNISISEALSLVFADNPELRQGIIK